MPHSFDDFYRLCPASPLKFFATTLGYTSFSCAFYLVFFKSFIVVLLVQRRRCYDRGTRVHHNEGSTWERRVRNATVDCSCRRSAALRRMLISCSGESKLDG